MNINLLGDIFSIIFGLCALIFFKALAHATVEFQYKLIGIRFNEKISQIIFLLVGLFLIILGILSIFKKT